jgi:hypothetical protein
VDSVTENGVAGEESELGTEERPEVRGRVTVRLQGKGPRRYEETFSVVFAAEEDALIESALAASPARSAPIYAGISWTGEGLQTGGGSAWKDLDYGYPSLQAAWVSLEERESIITNYRATFEAGTLDVKGIDKAGLFNRENARGLAFARIAPAIEAGPEDTLQLFWEIAVQR